MPNMVIAHQAKNAPTLYGGARQFWKCKDPEVILSGPYDTGKTFSTLHKLDALCWKYPNSFAFMARKTYKSLKNTVIKTFEGKVLPVLPNDPSSQVTKHGGENVDFYEYANGSRIICAGLDNPQKLLSAEFDWGYVNQAEEIPLDSWETLSTRCSGRSGNTPYTQLMADCNPGPPNHWIKHRKRLTFIEQFHKDNPTIYNQETGELLPEGKRRIDALLSLTGVRLLRGYHNKWVSEEGTVYEFLESVHRYDRSALPHRLTYYLSMDFGYTNPFVCQLWAVDFDGRLILINEIYMTRRTIEEHMPAINRMIEGKRIEAVVTDHDPERQAVLRKNGLKNVVNAKKDITIGIQNVRNRLAVQGDGLPRIMFCDDTVMEYDRELYREYPGDLHPCSTEHEFSLYVFPEEKPDINQKEVPIDANNHGMDAMRYMVQYLEAPETFSATVQNYA